MLEPESFIEIIEDMSATFERLNEVQVYHLGDIPEHIYGATMGRIRTWRETIEKTTDSRATVTTSKVHKVDTSGQDINDYGGHVSRTIYEVYIIYRGSYP